MKPDIQTTFNLTEKNGLYFKKDGKAYKAAKDCNIVKGKIAKAGYKVSVVPVGSKGSEGFAMRIMDMEATQSSNEKPTEGSNVEDVETLKQKIKELEGRVKEKEPVAEESSQKSPKRERPKRENRKPMTRNKLNFPERKGYRRRVVNDVDGGMRIKAFQEAGWEVVQDPYASVDSDGDGSSPSQMGSAVSRHVGPDDTGKPMHGILMEIPEEWYEEDQAAKQERITKAEQGLYNVDADPGGKFPVKGGIKVDNF